MKVFAFFGVDTEGAPDDLLVNYVRSGYTLLAMDAAAMAAAMNAGVQYTLIDDWIDARTRREVRRKGLECECSWYESARDLFTVNGICWPAYDCHAMHYFWQEVMLAQALATSFLKAGLQQLECVQRYPLLRVVFHTPASVTAAVWKYELGDKAVVNSFQQSNTQQAGIALFLHRAKRFCRKVIRRLRLRPHHREAPNTTQQHISADLAGENLYGRIWLVYAPNEIHRFAPFLERLRTVMPEKIAVACIHPHPSYAEPITSGFGLPAFDPPRSTSVDDSYGQQFQAGYLHVIAQSGDKPWANLPLNLRDHFEYYCCVRWPGLIAQLRAWKELWKRITPEAIVVSTNHECEGQLPAEAGRALGIPTFAIPHGAVDFPMEPLSAGYILCDDLVQKNVWEQYGLPPERILLCRGVVAEDEYPVNEVKYVSGKEQGVKLLALTNPVMVFGRLLMSGSYRAQLDAFSILNSPPPDLTDRVDVAVKAHPGFPETALFHAIRKTDNLSVLPQHSSLMPLLNDVDIVVSVNYIGSALIHVLRAGIPTIFLWTDELDVCPDWDVHGVLFLQGGCLATTSEEFWNLVRDFATDSEAARQMHEKARQFGSEYLDQHDYTPVGQVVRKVLEEGYQYSEVGLPSYISG